MRRAMLAMVLIGLTAGPASATALCPQPWCQRAEALVQRWLGAPAAGSGEVVAPPKGIDPQMALAPPGSKGALRIIRPPDRSEQR